MLALRLSLALLLSLGSLLNRLLLGLVLSHPLTASACYATHCRANSGTFSSITGDRSNSGATSSASCSAPQRSALADIFLGFLRSVLLGGLLLLCARPRWRRGLRVDTGVLTGRAIALALILELLI